MALAGTSTRRRYTYPYTSGSAISGTVPMATLPSKSLTQPGPPVVAPPARAPSVGSAMTAGAYGGGAMSTGAPTPVEQQYGANNFGQGDLSAARPTSEASPYERYYWEDIAAQRGIEAGREGEAGRLTSESEAYLTPQAWAHAGPDASYWKGEAARQLSTVNQQYNDDKVKIQWEFDTGQINDAMRRIKLDRLDREVAGKRAEAQRAVQSQRLTTGLAAAQDTAKSYAGLAGQVPRDRIAVREPARIGMETITGGTVAHNRVGNVGEPSNPQEFAVWAQKQGINWKTLSQPLKRAFADKYTYLERLV